MEKTSLFSIWGLFKNIIWKSLILTKKINFFLDNSPKGPFSVNKLVKKAKSGCYSKFSTLNALQYLFNIWKKFRLVFQNVEDRLGTGATLKNIIFMIFHSSHYSSAHRGGGTFWNFVMTRLLVFLCSATPEKGIPQNFVMTRLLVFLCSATPD